MRKNIPNILTLLNLFCGSVGVLFAASGDLKWAALSIFLGAVFDFLDGFVARLLGVSSPLGLQLDSLADVVTFGLLPGLIMRHLIIESLSDSNWDNSIIRLAGLSALSITLASAWRLAKFNIDKNQSDSFTGLPTPANGFFIASLPLILAYNDNELIINIICNTWVLLGIVFLGSWVMNAPVQMLSLKFKTFSFNKNKFRYIFLITALLSIVLFRFLGFALVVMSYISISIAKKYFSGK